MVGVLATAPGVSVPPSDRFGRILTAVQKGYTVTLQLSAPDFRPTDVVLSCQTDSLRIEQEITMRPIHSE